MAPTTARPTTSCTTWSASSITLSRPLRHDAYIEDAAGHDDVQSFFRQCAEQDAERAVKCHELLGKITGGGGL